MSAGLFMVVCHGYDNVYVKAESFDDARERWVDEYINFDSGDKAKINPMPDTIAFLCEEECLII